MVKKGRRANVKDRDRAPLPKPKQELTVEQLLEKVEEHIQTLDLDKAVKACQEAIEKEPGNAKAHELMGVIHLEQGDPETAFRCFAQAVAESPDEGSAKYLYIAQLSSGMDAVTNFSRGVELLHKEIEQPDADVNDIKKSICIAHTSVAEIYMTDLCFEPEAETECHKHIQLALQADPENVEALQVRIMQCFDLLFLVHTGFCQSDDGELFDEQAAT
eukprot:Colp12_sorted_trinity150504_noHs@35122